MLNKVFKRKKDDQNNTKEMELDESASPTPRLNFFKRVKQRILTVVTRRSPAVPQHPPSEISEEDCSIECRIGLRREVASEAEEDFDCSTAKSISTCSLLDQKSIESKSGDQSNLIEMLPMEILAHVASYLPVKDFNSLARTNLNNHGRLAKKHRRPLRVVLWLYDLTETGSYYIRLNVFVSSETASYCCCLKECDATGLTMKEKDKTDAVRRFYRDEESSSGIPIRNMKKFNFGVQMGLATHLAFLQSQNVVIDKIILYGFCKRSPTTSINNFLERNRMRVNNLSFLSCDLGEKEMELIRISEAKSIRMNNFRVMDGFYQHPLIRKLVTFASEICRMKEGDLPALEATTLWLQTTQGIPSKDVEVFLTQWIQSRRNYKWLYVEVRSLEPETTWRSLLARLDCSLVDISEIDTSHGASFTLRRRLDGQTMKMENTRAYLRMSVKSTELDRD